MRKVSKALVLIIAVMTVSWVPPLPKASSHTGFFSTKWILNCGSYCIPWRYTTSVPAAFRNAIQWGAAGTYYGWYPVKQPVRWHGAATPDYADFNPYKYCGALGQNAVHYRWLYDWDKASSSWKYSGKYGTLAVNWTCSYAGKINNSNIIIDRAETWHTAGSWSIPNTEIDLWGVMTHEFGHGLGFDHFAYSNGAALPECSTNYMTMCPYAAYGNQSVGLRTLDIHDIHTYDAAY